MGSVPRMSLPYRLALEKNWKDLEKFFEDHGEAVVFPLTVNQDKALHIAVHSGKKELLEVILKKAPDAYLMQNAYGNTALHEVTATEMVELAEFLLEYENKPKDDDMGIMAPYSPGFQDQKLIEIKNKLGETPVFRAAAFGKTKMVRTLLSPIEDMKPHRRRNDSTTILHIAVLGEYFEVALQLLQKDPDLGKMKDENGFTCLQLLANMPSAFKSGYSMGILRRILYFCLPDYDESDDNDDDNKNHKIHDLHFSKSKDLERGLSHQSNPLNNSRAISRMYTVWTYLSRAFPALEDLWSIKKKHKKAVMLAEKLAKMDLPVAKPDGYFGKIRSEKISLSNDEKDDEEERIPSPSEIGAVSQISSSRDTPIIAAARHGIIEIIEAILEVYPQVIEQVNEQDENIFHVAVRHRREEILDLLQHSYIPLSRLSRKINVKGDSILHQAAYPGEFQVRQRPGEALRLQSQIQWFERVKKIVPSYFINHRNAERKTAEELFTIQHHDLVDRGQEWLMRTAQACTLVAVLIATVAFTSAYTVPGGSNSKTGSPLLLNTTPFRVFTISDTLSLCFSLSSVVLFLSIMTSKMHEKDFRMSLPLKLVMGLTTLFFAVASMMVAFAATLVLMMRQRLHWAAIPIYSIVCFPVTIFLALQFPLYLNIAWFTIRDVVHNLIDFLPRWRLMSRTSMSASCFS